MQVGRDHQVTGCVRILIEDDKVVLRPMDHKGLIIPGRIPLRFTENAGVLRCIGGDFTDVFVSPGTPESFHDVTYDKGLPRDHNGFSLINSFNSFPALKYGTRLAGMLTGSPV